MCCIKRFALLLIVFFASSLLYPDAPIVKGVLFFHKAKPGDVFKIEGISKIKFFLNNSLSKTTMVGYKAVLKAKEDAGAVLFDYSYQSIDKTRNKIVSKGRGAFRRKPSGDVLNFRPGQFFPKSLGSPSFIGKAVPKMGVWYAPVIEKIDFRNIGIEKPFIIKSVARYRYLGTIVIDGKKLDIINAFYIADVNTQMRISRLNRELYPARLIGCYERTFYWDSSLGYWRKMEGKVNLILTFTNSLTAEWEISVEAIQHKS